MQIVCPKMEFISYLLYQGLKIQDIIMFSIFPHINPYMSMLINNITNGIIPRQAKNIGSYDIITGNSSL